MMFYSPHELIKNVSEEDIKAVNKIINYEKLANSPKQELILDTLKLEFDIKFLKKLNSEFFKETITVLEKRLKRTNEEILKLNKPKEQPIRIEMSKTPKLNIAKEPRKEDQREISEEDILRRLIEILF